MSRGYPQVHSKLIQDTSKISQLSSNGTTCVAKQHRLVPCRAHRCRALPQWEAAPGSPDEAWAMHVPKKKPFTSIHIFTLVQMVSTWLLNYVLLERAEFHLGNLLIWVIVCEGLQPSCAMSIQYLPTRWKGESRTVQHCSHILSLDKLAQMFPQSGFGLLTSHVWKL